MPPEVRPVWQLLRYVKVLVEQDRQLSDIWVGGEVSNLTLASSGHMYFTLKDQGGAIRCVFFRQKNVGQRERLVQGASLIVHGGVSVYEQRGDLQMLVDFVQPAGVGALAAEYERRKARFETEGLFAAERKRPLPRFPRRIGVVTSARGAAFHDIQTVLARRWPLAAIVFCSTPVQGDDAAVEIAEAIRAIAPRDHPAAWPDVLIVGRGGGSAEDLWAFNEEPVVRAIFGCPVPVVSAVGHETDFSLADLVADMRAPTPSAAAELVVPDRIEVMQAIASMQWRHHQRIARNLDGARERGARLERSLERALPDVPRLRHELAMHADLMRGAATVATTHARQGVARMLSRLEALSPLATLDRGYALVSRAGGGLVTSAAEVAPGDRLEIRWRDGAHAARVESP
ncbi:MAG: exodeoxyribonuclease VII large subunit [Dehalococcoidia bacterium]